MVRLPRLGRDQTRVEPTAPHRFQEIHDAGLAAMGGGGPGGSYGSQTLNSVALTNNYMRKRNCGVPGCGKPRQDPIHERAEE